jgi:hypothetical protein
MSLPLVFAAFLHFDQGLAAPPLNCTLPLSSPLHFSDDCKVLCRPAKWTDVLIFYLGNYAAHAATTKLSPGASTFSSILSIVAALLFPTSGVLRGSKAILSRAIFAKTELRTAVRAGAVYAVERPGDSPLYPLESPEIRKRDLVMSITCRKNHGRISLPEGWRLVPVKSGTEFENDEPGPSGIFEPFKAPFRRPDLQRMRLANSYSAVKSIVAIVQACFSITTLYRTRGTQIDQFGYAAFGLTVAPYAFMSIVNLIGNLVCPEYPGVFIVENTELDKLRERIAAEGKEAEFFVESTVGRVAEATNQSVVGDPEDVGEATAERRNSMQQFDAVREDENGRDIRKVYPARVRKNAQGRKRWYSPFTDLSTRIQARKKDILELTIMQLYILAITVSGAAVPISIVGGLSGFKEGRSTHVQRVWTMTWLAFGVAVGSSFPFVIDFEKSFDRIRGEEGSQYFIMVLLMLVVVYGAPAVGGFIVVGQMITQYGTCINVA